MRPTVSPSGGRHQVRRDDARRRPGLRRERRRQAQAAKTVVWNGPFGAFELPPFGTATVAVAQAAADLTDAGKLLSVAGGGDTVAALNHAGWRSASPMYPPPWAPSSMARGQGAAGCRGATALKPSSGPREARDTETGNGPGAITRSTRIFPMRAGFICFAREREMTASLEEVAYKLAAGGKGILAADETRAPSRSVSTRSGSNRPSRTVATIARCCSAPTRR